MTLTPQECADRWNGATTENPYTRDRFDADTQGLDWTNAELADAYLHALDEGYKRFQAVQWSGAALLDAYGRLDESLRYHPDAVTLPPPPPAEVPHHFDGLPIGTVIVKTVEGFALHPPGSFTPTGPAIGVHSGGFNGFWHRVIHWLHLG